MTDRQVLFVFDLNERHSDRLYLFLTCMNDRQIEETANLLPVFTQAEYTVRLWMEISARLDCVGQEAACFFRARWTTTLLSPACLDLCGFYQRPRLSSIWQIDLNQTGSHVLSCRHC